MNFLITEDEVAIINSDDIKLGQQVPLGFWKLDAAQFKGIFLKRTDFKLSHGKIYGKSQNIANHIVQAYKYAPEDKNMGVLLSGGRGLGKTLTTRLVIEQLAKNHPIVIVSGAMARNPIVESPKFGEILLTFAVRIKNI